MLTPTLKARITGEEAKGSSPRIRGMLAERTRMAMQ